MLISGSFYLPPDGAEASGDGEMGGKGMLRAGLFRKPDDCGEFGDCGLGMAVCRPVHQGQFEGVDAAEAVVILGEDADAAEVGGGAGLVQPHVDLENAEECLAGGCGRGF